MSRDCSKKFSPILRRTRRKTAELPGVTYLFLPKGGSAFFIFMSLLINNGFNQGVRHVWKGVFDLGRHFDFLPDDCMFPQQNL